MSLHALHAFTYAYVHYMQLHLVTFITFLYTHLLGFYMLFTFLGAVAPPNEPAEQLVLPPPRPAPQTDPSLLIGKVCAAIHAGPDAYNNAIAQWRARFPAAAFPDRRARRDFELGDASGSQRMRGPANFSRSLAEYMAGWEHADISYEKADRWLGVSANIRFNPEHFPSMSLRTLERMLVKTIFPDGHSTTDLTRPEDGNQKIIFHYIPFTECVRRQLSRRAFAGRQYFEYEPQKCPRNPDARGYGRVNSGTWFEAAQLRANQLAAAGGHVEKCAVAGLVWVSDASFGGKNTSWHGVYCKWNPASCICSAASTM